MFNKQKAAAITAVRNRNARARNQIDHALDRYPPVQHRDVIEAMLIDPAVVGYLPISNFAVRFAAQEALIDAVLDHYASIRRCSQTRHFFFTAAIDAGFTFLCGPMVDLADLQRKVVAALDRVGLHGVCAFEIDVLSKTLPYNPPHVLDEPGRRVLFHVHAITWTTDASFQPVVAANNLMKLRSYPNALDIPAIDICTRAMSCARRGETLTLLHRDQTAASVVTMAAYMLKMPIVARNYVPPIDGKRGRLYDDARAYGLNTALRMMELHSHIPAGCAVFGVGEGAEVANAYRQAVRDWARTDAPHARHLDRSEVGPAWSMLWRRYPDLAFWPPRITMRAS